MSSRSSFTLIELLIVIAIIAVLATVVILILNPAQLLAQARDSTRMSDMTNLKQALSLYQTNVGGSLGDATSTLYVSIPDPSATSTLGDQCQGLGMSTSSLPSGWSYHCAASSTYKDINGEGWIPVDFEKISGGSPLASLPVDPVNTTSSGLYYTYVGYGDPYELTALFESSKYQAQAAEDGGPDPATYEVGSDLTLAPFAHGLVGYWKLDEGSGTIAYDSSGMGDNGTWYGTATGTSGYYSPGHNQTWAGAFDGTTTYITAADENGISGSDAASLVVWANLTNSNIYRGILQISTENNFYIRMEGTTLDSAIAEVWHAVLAGNVNQGTWTFLAVTYNGSTITNYVDGAAVGTAPLSGALTGGVLMIGSRLAGENDQTTNNNEKFEGYLDDIRLYNRALSASEIEAIYNTEK